MGECGGAWDRMWTSQQATIRNQSIKVAEPQWNAKRERSQIRPQRPPRSYIAGLDKIDILLGAKVFRQRYTAEQVAKREQTLFDGMEVKVADEQQVEADDERDRGRDVDHLALPLVLAHYRERHDDVRVSDAKHDPEEVREIVDPRQEAKEEEEKNVAEYTERAYVRRLQQMPHIEHLD